MNIVTVTNSSNSPIQHDNTNNQSDIKVEVMMLLVCECILMLSECLNFSTQV